MAQFTVNAGRLDPSSWAGRDFVIVIVTGAWTNMPIEHAARTGADKGAFALAGTSRPSRLGRGSHREQAAALDRQ